MIKIISSSIASTVGSSLSVINTAAKIADTNLFVILQESRSDAHTDLMNLPTSQEERDSVASLVETNKFA